MLLSAELFIHRYSCSIINYLTQFANLENLPLFLWPAESHLHREVTRDVGGSGGGNSLR